MTLTKLLLPSVLFVGLACAGCGGVDEGEALDEDPAFETTAAAQTSAEVELQPGRICIVRDARTDPNAIRCRLPGMVWWRCEQGTTVTYTCTWWFQEP